jgi:outer membrane protein OmpA-like peptidoglycan-associated protein
MKNVKRILCGALCFAVLTAVPVPAADRENAQGPALAPSLEGLTVSRYDTKELDEYVLPVGPLIANQPGDVLKLEGKVTKILYAAPMNKSPYEICRHYEKVLGQNGFTVLFSGSGEKLENWASVYYHDSYSVQGNRETQRYLCGKLTRPGGDTYVAVYSSIGWHPFASTRVDVIEVPAAGPDASAKAHPAADPAVAVPGQPAPAADNRYEVRLKTDGKVVAEGVTFMEGSDELRPGSEAVLRDIAAALRHNPGMKCAVMCYTDSIGTPEYCRALAARRAEKALRYLMMYGADKTRLTARGAGWVPAAPGEAAGGNRIELVVEK